MPATELVLDTYVRKLGTYVRKLGTYVRKLGTYTKVFKKHKRS